MNGDHSEMISFLSDDTISLGANMENFTLDHVFDTESNQHDVYNLVGKPVIEDVLNGYNGTIFAYGQTGSGKTHTMMGKSIFDDDQRGIIPRAASHIFETVNSDFGEIEYTLKCSMLEIYKETLRDLLQSHQINLRIKQCPRKGIYVQGLTEVCITNEKDMLEVLELGDQMRAVASTRLNQTSSRSHLLFILEVNQKLPNDSEKKGKLNLVDLAGSEKVNNSGVTGNKLEEAKKINLSLSALGNVIHALISYSDHIPYRDSKLTRLLQESLGGNYKTTLIVACSPSPKTFEETLNTLKFAVRAKKIRNKVTVNIKNSPESYIQIIEQLKLDLMSAKREINLLRAEIASTSVSDRSQTSSCLSPILTDPGIRQLTRSKTIQNSVKITPRESLESSRGSLNEDSDKKLSYAAFETDSLATSFNTTDKHLDTSYFPSPDSEVILKYENIERKSIKIKKKINYLKRENADLKEKNTDLESKLASSKTKQLQNEQRAHEYYEKYNKLLLMSTKENNEIKLLHFENEKLIYQVNKFTKALQELNQKYEQTADKFSDIQQTTQVEFEDLSELSISQCGTPVITDNEIIESGTCKLENLEFITNILNIDPES